MEKFLKRVKRLRVPLNPSIRVAVMGSARVGKTSIIKRLLDNSFTTEYKETIEDMYRINMKGIELEIVDTTGAYCFPAMRDLAIRTADVFVLVFAWDNNESFEHIKYLMDKINEIRDTVDHIVVAGNKMDLLTKTVSLVQTEMVVRLDWDRSFQECSAKENKNITRLFEDIVDAISAKRNAASALSLPNLGFR